MEWSTNLANLIRQLDAFETEPTLIQLSNTLKGAGLRAEDVAGFVRETSNTYHRGSVVRRDHYELLVITWKVGQGSVPHDHSGSVSAMIVLQGKAAEGSYRLADDGYADLEFETVYEEGELTAWQDAGVHAVRNASSDTTLITINVYAAPLKDFRRFNRRPRSGVLARSESKVPTVAIIGGGFSGSMTAAQLLRMSHRHDVPIRVVLIERQGFIGEGVAYSTRDPKHLLNVVAGRMSAWPEKPNDFVEWLSRNHGIEDPLAFVPRQWYGQYVRETLISTSQSPSIQSEFSVILDEVRRMTRRPDGGWLVNFSKHPSLSCDDAVLAIGHRPPNDPIGKSWSGSRQRLIADPWQPFAWSSIEPKDSVVVLGSGLTAVDTVLSLASEERIAPVYLISRRGLLPQQHSPQPIPAAPLGPWIEESLVSDPSINAWTKLLRQKIDETERGGGDWRSVIDGLRPHTATLWRALSHRDRHRFLRHLRAFWEVHRHRTASQVSERFNELLKSGRVKILAGRIVAAQADSNGVRMFVRERGDDRLLDIATSWVVNCTGPGPSNSPESNPAIGSLLIPDWVRSDPLSLGLETTNEGLALGGRGKQAEDLFVVGTLRKPSTWESTAVPELRVQAGQVAECILRRHYAGIVNNPEVAWTI
jgi:uncharacterized NAD(P)/FAD-binding protein YdhS/predicted metal-dependent enzyme (double-stranded beta helix superfamily)